MTTEQAQAIEKGIKEMGGKYFSWGKFTEHDLKKDLRTFATSLLSTKEPETVGEWEKSFDDKCMDGDFGSGINVYEIKSFIRSLLTSKLNEQRKEMIERLPERKSELGNEPYYEKGFNDRLKDVHEALKG